MAAGADNKTSLWISKLEPETSKPPSSSPGGQEGVDLVDENHSRLVNLKMTGVIRTLEMDVLMHMKFFHRS